MLAKSSVWVVEVEGWKERLVVVSGESVIQEQERKKVFSILPSCVELQ